MTEIEKMFENAGIKKEFEKPAKCSKNPYITCNGCLFYDNKKGKCNNRKDYSPFTAEKQIELIKWLGKRPLTLLIGRRKGKYYFGNSNFNSKADSFDNAIAIRINDLWQNLTEEERKRIKEILK